MGQLSRRSEVDDERDFPDPLAVAVAGRGDDDPVLGLMTAAQIAEAQELSTTLFARINGGG